jgi:hypothetical protein
MAVRYIDLDWSNTTAKNDFFSDINFDHFEASLVHRTGFVLLYNEKLRLLSLSLTSNVSFSFFAVQIVITLFQVIEIHGPL